ESKPSSTVEGAEPGEVGQRYRVVERDRASRDGPAHHIQDIVGDGAAGIVYVPIGVLWPRGQSRSLPPSIGSRIVDLSMGWPAREIGWSSDEVDELPVRHRRRVEHTNRNG